MTAGRSDDFKKHFCGTHFFNPPRYLRLLEIIPTPDTDPAVTSFLLNYGDLFLGKTTVLCKDTPAFIANRIGVFGMMAIMNAMEKLQLTIDEIEALTGPIIGRPKSATFRTADVVGIDTLVKVANGVYDNCLQDEARENFVIPGWLNKMVENKWLGDKTKQGFFKKMPPSESGEKQIHVLNLSSLEYEPRKKPRFATLETAKPIEDLPTRLKALFSGTDKAGEFYRIFHYNLFSYISHRIPEITDELYRVDDGMMAGFGWEVGAFESWDILGVAKTTAAYEYDEYEPDPYADIGAEWEQRLREERLWVAMQQMRLDTYWATLDQGAAAVQEQEAAEQADLEATIEELHREELEAQEALMQQDEAILAEWEESD
jgi:3-hydroxyacyl-CoA dehydrogenase